MTSDPGSTIASVPGRVAQGRLLAVSDLHVGMAENRPILESLCPSHEADCLIVAGDVAELTGDILWGLEQLAGRFAQVVWVPGNHELWTLPDDPIPLRGEARYDHLVQRCRDLGVVTPEDPWPVWQGAGGPVVVAPLFVGYDYSFRVPGTTTTAQSLAIAREREVVCTDEYFLHADPHPTRESWCRERVAYTETRLTQHVTAHGDALPLVLVNHYPLVREPTDVLWRPEFAQWCGTELTGDWHRRFPVAAVVYGHLHIPRTTWHDGVRFEEVSIGYPREWRRRGHPRGLLRQILPAEPTPTERPAAVGSGHAR